MRKSVPVRIGVDTGGTFTDCVTLEGSKIRVLKVFSTPDDPARGIVQGVRRLMDDVASVPRKRASSGLGTSTSALRTPRSEAPLEIIHGTTVGTNTLIERKGARVVLVTTAGFEDVIELGRQNRPRLYDLEVRREPPLVSRHLRFGVRERTAADASVLRPPSRRELERVVARVRKAKADSVALCLLFSYSNPSNESAVAKKLRGLGLPLSVSHEILPEFREYERISTVVVNAYLAPRLGAYLPSLANALGADGKAPVRISVMQSSGGITTSLRAAREPVRTILSGPAGGVMATARLAERLRVQCAISFDMGGTSTDVSLLDGAPRTTRETTLAGLPVAVPVLDVHSVGAGGGSLARFDAGGALRVGPESAGAVPGPICYGRGGSLPTVTDAHLILGRLDACHFLGRTLRLDLEAALDGFCRFLSRQARRVPQRLLPPTALDLARGIVAVANATMERALRVISVERGHDPRDFTLVSFGGAGGLHGADLARALGITQVIVPRDPGAFSAIGVLLSDAVKDKSRSILLPVPATEQSAPGGDRHDMKKDREGMRQPSLGGFLKTVERLFVRLERAGRAELRAEGFEGKTSVERRLDLRYVGQSFELTVPFNAHFREAFEHEHERAYGHAQAGRPLEAVNLRVRLSIGTPQPPVPRELVRPSRKKPPQDAVLGQKLVWFGNQMTDAALYDRARLPSGAGFRGPAVICEYSSTTLVPPDFRCRVDGEGNLVLARLR